MTEEETTTATPTYRDDNSTSNLTSIKVFKKSAQNNKITLYLGTRNIVITDKVAEKVQGVIYVDPDYLQDKKIYGQISLNFRYGREDEEVMGLTFCNEAIMCLAQLYPPHENVAQQPLTPLQEALLKRLGPNAHPFTMEITPVAPPSVQLVPAKEYNGAPIGTSYDIKAFAANRVDEKQQRKNTVRMGIRVVQRATMVAASLQQSKLTAAAANSAAQNFGEENRPRATLNKTFLFSDGAIKLEAALDKAVYSHEDSVNVTVSVNNETKKNIRRLKLLVIQHVDVCMFSNGKFKNVVGFIDSEEECPLRPGTSLVKTYTLNPAKGAPKNWIALEDTCMGSGTTNTGSTSPLLAPTVTCNAPEERNVFAIYVSYYVKVKLLVGTIGGKISVKLPFTLTPSSVSLSPAISDQIENESSNQFTESYSPLQLGTTTTMTNSAGDDDDVRTKNENNDDDVRIRNAEDATSITDI